MAVRVAPFVTFLLLTFVQGDFGQGARYWVYLVKSLVGIWLFWEMRPFVLEMRWRFSWEAVVIGVGVCVMWIALGTGLATQSVLWETLGISKPPEKPLLPWNPHAQFGDGSDLAWFFIAVRILGSSLVVPPIEEVFYRSFLYRYITKVDFESVKLTDFAWKPFLITSLIFGFAHHEWLAGILCGMAYQWLVIRKGRLGDAMTAHAITNFLLGVWVVWMGDWKFW